MRLVAFRPYPMSTISITVSTAPMARGVNLPSAQSVAQGNPALVPANAMTLLVKSPNTNSGIIAFGLFAAGNGGPAQLPGLYGLDGVTVTGNAVGNFVILPGESEVISLDSENQRLLRVNSLFLSAIASAGTNNVLFISQGRDGI